LLIRKRVSCGRRRTNGMELAPVPMFITCHGLRMTAHPVQH
jgi:hypothetical protein